MTSKKPITIPSNLLGAWTDNTSKHLLIEQVKNEIFVSVFNGKKKPFRLLLLKERTTISVRLKAKFIKETDNYILQTEAGTIGLGPTYNLALTLNNKNKVIELKPSVSMGLYDDWDDDLGVPWAFPLNKFSKNKTNPFNTTFWLYLLITPSSLIYPMFQKGKRSTVFKVLMGLTVIISIIYFALKLKLFNL